MDPGELAAIEDALAEILLLPELAGPLPTAPARGAVPGSHPLWGRTSYAGPPLGGEHERWLVVSHDAFNRTSGRALCVRTTSNLSLVGPDSPAIEGGRAAAICADVVSRAHGRFALGSALGLPQPAVQELSAAARGLVNALRLGRAAGLG